MEYSEKEIAFVVQEAYQDGYSQGFCNAMDLFENKVGES